MPSERHYRIVSIADAKARAKKARSVAIAMSRIKRLCKQALEAKTSKELQSAVEALRIAVERL
jgi:hypothetical protein